MKLQRLGKYCGGFTLIEFVMVIVLIGILAVAAAPRVGDMTGMNAAALAGKLRADIRYAQDLAMTRNARSRVTFRTAPPNGYDITLAGSPVTDPATGGAFSVDLNTGYYAGVRIAAAGFTGSYVEFNTLGVPYDGGGALVAGKSVTVTGGGTTLTVTVHPDTGAVN